MLITYRYYEDLACPEVDQVIVDRMKAGEKIGLPYGKIMERLLMLKLLRRTDPGKNHKFTPEIPPRVMASSAIWGSIMGFFLVFSDHTCKSKCNRDAFTMFVRHAAYYACLSSHADRSTCS